MAEQAGGLISFDEAFARMRALAAPRERQTIALERAAGLWLAAPVHARRDAPPFDASAMDGYAVREADLAEAPVTLPLAGVSAAGGAAPSPLAMGRCARIFTGAALPPGADRVVIQENVVAGPDGVRFPVPPSGPRHIRPRGSDFRAGEELLPAGRRLDARALIAAAAADKAELEVWRRPRVILIATGDELVAPGAAGERADAIPESASLGVAALVTEAGGEVLARERVRDDLPALAAAAEAALARADLVVMTGGASVGARDYAKAAFAGAGLALAIAKVAMKPGKPVWLGEARGRLVMGLPGNPTSAFVTARLLLAPLVAGLAGGDPDALLRWERAELAAPLAETGDRETFVRARMVAPGPPPRLAPLTQQDSSSQAALALSDALIRRPPSAPGVAAGAEVEALRL